MARVLNAEQTNTQVPAALRDLRQWVNWRYDERPGNKKPTKVPYMPNGTKASTTNAATWSSLADVLAAAHQFNGIGFVFAKGGGIFGFDADHMYDPATGVITSEAAYWLRALATYAEFSPSHDGIHALGFGVLPGPGRNPADSPFELYDQDRFFTFTGNHLGEFPAELTTADPELLGDLYTLLSRQEIPSAPGGSGTGTSYLGDDALLDRARNAKNGTKFDALWRGDTSSFGGDDSSADMALCNLLAFWCNKDTTQMDRLFRRCDLMRPKWDTRRGSGTYGARTIAEAIRITQETYNPGQPVRLAARQNVNPETGELHESAAPDYEYTDLGNGDRFADTYRDQLVYCRYGPTSGDWRAWDGTRWAIEPSDAIMARAGAVARAMFLASADSLSTFEGKTLAKHALKTQSDSRLSAMINQAKNGLATWASDYDRDPWLFNCPNGTLNLQTNVFSTHDPADHITKLAGAPYDPDTRCPRFLAFLEKFQPDVTMRAFLQRAIGYSLTGITTEQCLFFAYGIGGNGKSTLMNVLQALLGEYAGIAGAETFMIKRSDGGINNDVADLAGARAVITGEMEDGKRFAEALIKAMTGSDKIKARFLHKEFFSFAPQFKLWVQGNHKPVIRGTDEGIWRRIRLIPFDVHIDDDERIKGFSDALIRDELPGILAWAVLGCLDWQDCGLTIPDAIKTATRNYRSEMDVLASFLDDCCVVASKNEVAKGRLYEVYHSWAKGGEEFVMSKTMFSRRLLERGIEDRATHAGRVWSGISIKPGVV